MEARLVSELPEDGDWQFEPKWDGFRCLAFRNGNRVELRAKSGKQLTRYFPEIVSALGEISAARFVVDGELLIALGDGLSFGALQMRLHPAQSRIERLARETPALLMLFDMLEDANGHSLLECPLRKRRAALEKFAAAIPANARFRLSPFTRERKEAAAWLALAGRGALDGVIAKPLGAPYLPGERAARKTIV
jgi:ATP-dependent DNA ligase